MASFLKGILKIAKEGGYKLINSSKKGDRGGRTYAGISERANPKWEGWKIIVNSPSINTFQLRDAVHACYT